MLFVPRTYNSVPIQVRCTVVIVAMIIIVSRSTGKYVILQNIYSGMVIIQSVRINETRLYIL